MITGTIKMQYVNQSGISLLKCTHDNFEPTQVNK